MPVSTLFRSISVVVAALGYLAVYFAAHLFFGVLVWLLYLPVARKLGGGRNLSALRGVVVYLACGWWLLLFHSAQYPNSMLAVNSGAPLFRWAYWLLSAGVAVLVGFAFYQFRNSFTANFRPWPVSLLVVGLSVATIAAHVGGDEGARPAAKGLPDVIVIGIDSLRPDHLQRSGLAENITPNLNDLLKQSAVFENASTPLARTFPSWMSLLTGLEPVRHGGRFNLMPPALVDGDRSVAHLFKRRGYRTVYATDESRFSNIDRRYGFEEVLAPRYGFGDFLIGSANDAPLTNLLVNSAAGRLVLPFSHANRAAHITYRPETFDADLRQLVGAGGGRRPMFLAVHFCLPHWPYKWSGKDRIGFSGYRPATMANEYQLYLESLHRADRQIGELLRHLDEAGRLNNALVVFISDHGESFRLDKDRLYSGSAASETSSLPQLFGHAVSVVDSSQYQVLLAFRSYGNADVAAKSFATPVSLVDVAPTVADYALGESLGNIDGISLAGAIRDGENPPAGRIFTRESGFSVPAMLDSKPDMAAVFHQGAVYYNLHPVSGRLELKRELLADLLRYKQRAVVRDRWILAVTPGEESGAYLVDTESKRFWREGEFGDAAAPAELLINALCASYRDDAEFLPQKLCGSGLD